MWRKAVVWILLSLAVPASTVLADDSLLLRIDGRILRKSSGRLVLSLSAFELDGQDSVTLENRKSRERKTVRLSSVYDDICYSEPLPPAEFENLDPDGWIPFVTWRIPLNNAELNRRLTAVHEQQNVLRHAMGNALMEDDEVAGKVTSRATLNKIEKYHRLGNRIAQEIMRSWNKEETNPFFFPVRIQIGFNPFEGKAGAASLQAPLLQAREVIYWELNRLLTQQYGIDERLVPLVFNSPGTVRNIVPLGKMSREERIAFSPQIFMSSESLDGAVYLIRQDFVQDLRNALRTRQFLDPFVTDRAVLDAFVNEGKVAAVVGNKLALTFIPPFVAPRERLEVLVDADGETRIPVVVESLFEVEGYSMTADLPDDVVSRVKAGMRVVRRKPGE